MIPWLCNFLSLVAKNQALNGVQFKRTGMLNRPKVLLTVLANRPSLPPHRR